MKRNLFPRASESWPRPARLQVTMEVQRICGFMQRAVSNIPPVEPLSRDIGNDGQCSSSLMEHIKFCQLVFHDMHLQYEEIDLCNHLKMYAMCVVMCIDMHGLHT